MVSVVSGGTTERMVTCNFLRALRAGSGTAAKYSATSLGLFLFMARLESGADSGRDLILLSSARWISAIDGCQAGFGIAITRHLILRNGGFEFCDFGGTQFYVGCGR